VFDDSAEAAIFVKSAASERHWVLTLTIETGARVAAQRELEGPVGDCDGLMAGALLTLELLLGAEAPQNSPKPQPTSASATLPPSSSPAELNRRERIEPPRAAVAQASAGLDERTDAGRIEVALRALIHLTTLPGSTPGAGVAGAFEFSPRLWAHLGLGRSMPVTVAQPVDGQRITSNFTLTHANVAVSWAALETRSSRLRLGVEGHLGSLRAEVDGAAPWGPDKHTWTALGASGGLQTRPVDPIHLTLAASLLFPLSAREFGVREGPVLASLPPVGGWIEWAIGLQW
jgi:hypothetical protein